MGVTSPAARQQARRVASVVGKSRTARAAARAGLVARAGFYLLLAALVAKVAADGTSSGAQTNAHGALSVLAGAWWGLAAIVVAALALLVLGVVRVAAAVRDREADARHRLGTLAQGLFYIGLTWIPMAFVLGSRRVGSDRSERSETATVLGWPGGRELVAAVGVIVLVVCGYQIVTALRRDFTDSLDLGTTPGWLRRVVTGLGVAGIVARAAVFVPLALFLFVAAWDSNPRHARGLDNELGLAARQPWGPAVLALVALGLLVFAAYTLVEARYLRLAESD